MLECRTSLGPGRNLGWSRCTEDGLTSPRLRRIMRLSMCEELAGCCLSLHGLSEQTSPPQWGGLGLPRRVAGGRESVLSTKLKTDSWESIKGGWANDSSFSGITFLTPKAKVDPTVYPLISSSIQSPKFSKA